MTATLAAPKYALYDYQEQAVQFLRARRRAGLLLDMGLGKTAISLSALTPDMLPVLVTGPKRVAEEVWDVERDIWRPDLSITVVKGSAAQRAKLLQSKADIIVISRDNCAEALPLAEAGHFKTFIIDELSGYKNRSSQRWKTAKKISNNVRQLWGLTGTPAPNGLLDMWAQAFLIDGGEALGTTVGGYRERYFSAGRRMPNGIVTRWDLRPGADKRIHKLLERSFLSMSTEGRVKLPPVTYNEVKVPLTPQVTKLYKQMKDNLVVDMSILGGEIHSAETAAALTNKLSQLTAGFMYVDDADVRGKLYTKVHTEKVKALQEIIDGTGGSPVLVSYRFQAELQMLKAELGDMAHTIDEPNAVKRWNAGQLPVMLVHPASAGHGLNLQHGGHTMVWASLPWSLEEYQQTNKRLARNGQQHPVVIHHLLSPGTVDYTVLQALRTKDNIQAALMAHLESPL